MIFLPLFSQTAMSTERFDCHYCKDSLLGKKYILKEDTQYCTKCYENLFANCCESCSLPIGCNNKVWKGFPFVFPILALYVSQSWAKIHSSSQMSDVCKIFPFTNSITMNKWVSKSYAGRHKIHLNHYIYHSLISKLTQEANIHANLSRNYSVD